MKWLDYRLQWERTRRVVPYVVKGARVLDIACADGALFRVLDDRLSDFGLRWRLGGAGGLLFGTETRLFGSSVFRLAVLFGGQ